MAKKKDTAVKTISLVMIITLVGKLLGLLRDRLLTINYGSGMETNAFLTASRIPRVFFDAVFASAIAACFIGGASASGGTGKITGVIIGATLMGVINQGMSIMGISLNYQRAVKGIVLLVAVLVDVLSKKEKA